MDLEKLTIKELQDKLVDLGMPEDDVQAFKTKAPLIASIRTLTARDMISEEKPEPVELKEVEPKKVATIEETPNPSEDRQVNKKWKNKAELMKNHLMAQEKVSILVPLEIGETVGVVEMRGKAGEEYQAHVSGAIETVQLNGFKYFIPKGRYTQVPRQIAEIISRAQQQTLDAGRDISMNRIDERTGRPFSEIL